MPRHTSRTTPDTERKNQRDYESGRSTGRSTGRSRGRGRGRGKVRGNRPNNKLPGRLYGLFEKISACDLVANKNVTADSMQEFNDLLNATMTSHNNLKEFYYKEMTKNMHNANPSNFYKYVSDASNDLQPLVLWTTRANIAEFFDIKTLVYISWNRSARKFDTRKFEVREPRTNTRRKSVSYSDDNEIINNMLENAKPKTKPQTEESTLKTNQTESKKDSKEFNKELNKELDEALKNSLTLSGKSWADESM